MPLGFDYFYTQFYTQFDLGFIARFVMWTRRSFSGSAFANGA
jgi:hypothetical protein